MTWTLREVVGLLLASLAVWTTAGFAAGRWARGRLLDQVHDAGYEMGWDDSLDQGLPDPDETIVPVTLPVIRELLPAALEAASEVPLPSYDDGSQRDVPRPGLGDCRNEPSETGLGHLSPYEGTLTPAQRRRDKHKQRGQYAPEAEPDPIDWTGELAAIRVNGQTDWFTEMMAQVA